jgi:hypothetical protein
MGEREREREREGERELVSEAKRKIWSGRKFTVGHKGQEPERESAPRVNLPANSEQVQVWLKRLGSIRMTRRAEEEVLRITAEASLDFKSTPRSRKGRESCTRRMEFDESGLVHATSFVRVDICLEGCCLFRGDLEHETVGACGSPRYKSRRSLSGRKIPHFSMCHNPLKRCFKRILSVQSNVDAFVAWWHTAESQDAAQSNRKEETMREWSRIFRMAACGKACS